MKNTVGDIKEAGAHQYAEARGNGINQRRASPLHIRTDGGKEDRCRSAEGDTHQQGKGRFKVHGACKTQRLYNTYRRGSGLEQSGEERTDQNADDGV